MQETITTFLVRPVGDYGWYVVARFQIGACSTATPIAGPFKTEENAQAWLDDYRRPETKLIAGAQNHD